MIIGLDVGGTHTDVVLLGAKGVIREAKFPTNKDNLFDSVWQGIKNVIKDVDVSFIRRAVLSTTLTTNLVVEKKTAPVGMIVSSGPGIDPQAFCMGDEYHIVSGSIDHRGREVQPINTDEINAIADHLAKSGIQQVGIVGKFSTRNPIHEKQIATILNNRFDVIVQGHQLSGMLNFPRRIATCYINAAVFPENRQFFQSILQSFKQHGLNVPIFTLKADAGTMNLKSSLNHPGQTILSGPAASVMGAIPYTRENSDTLVLDIGGTTTDMAIVVNRVPLLDPIGIELAGYKTLIRSLKTHSIGLGGDSVVRLIDGTLTVGPDRKGPALAFGGTEPTPTDAMFVLDDPIEGGNKQASINGFNAIAQKMNISVKSAAQKVLTIACEKILSEADDMIARINSKPVYTVHEILQGKQVQPTEILILGGPAPFFSKRLEVLTPKKVRVAPKWGVANAIGAALARTTCQVTLFADTEQGYVTSPEDNYSAPIDRNFTEEDALALAMSLLKEKAIKRGAESEDLETEILENIQFNMIRGFYTTGKNIRVKVQVKPGLIRSYGKNMATS
ncbi:MAG: hydantoinase/oxoprolinase family protein [Candidatus Magnetomorum sp.]|nr:hydantoinase/oxoprolinase family protein [Candidatus Magnetomorum sp.]